MIRTIKNAFRIKEIRKRLRFVLFILIIVRIGSQIPVPGVNPTFLSAYLGNGAFEFLDTFSGGGLSNFSIFALSITPYITASIIVQLLTIAIPKLEELQKDGEDGRKKLNRITRYVTLFLALFESISLCIGFKSKMILEFNVINVMAVAAVLTTGSNFLMWLGERINEKGVGNGISIILLINILSGIPSDVRTLWDNFIYGKTIAMSVVTGFIIIAIALAITIFSICLNDATREIPIVYSKRISGSNAMMGRSANIPVKTNTSGVVPVIFATSIMAMPNIIITFMGKSATGIWQHITKALAPSAWFGTATWYETIIGVAIYVLLLYFFARFYTMLTYNPDEIAGNLRKQGGTIPGIRPGKPTADYLHGIIDKQTIIGCTGLLIITMIAYFINGFFGASLSLGGTSMLIIVSVMLETSKQIESMMVVRHHKGFLN